MSDQVILPHKYALVLLQKLGNDVYFRSRFELSPPSALGELGIPAEVMSRVFPESLRPMKLADCEVFKEALVLLMDELVSVSLCHVQPQIHVFSPIRGRGVKSSIGFGAQNHSHPATQTNSSRRELDQVAPEIA